MNEITRTHKRPISKCAPTWTLTVVTLKSLRSYPRPALCQRDPLPIQILPTYNHSHHSRGNYMTPVTRIHKRPISKCTRPEPLLLLPSDHSYFRPALCQRIPLPIQISSTYRHSRHPRGDDMTRSHAQTKSQSQNAPDLDPSSVSLGSLRSYFQASPWQRNSLPIQTPPTYRHSHHPRGDDMTPVTRTHKRPIPKCTPTWTPPVLVWDHWDHTPGRPSPRGTLSQFKPHPPTDTPATLGMTILLWSRVHTKGHSQNALDLNPQVLASDYRDHTRGWPSAKGILFQFNSSPLTATKSHPPPTPSISLWIKLQDTSIGGKHRNSRQIQEPMLQSLSPSCFRTPLESHHSVLPDVARLTKCCTCAVVGCNVVSCIAVSCSELQCVAVFFSAIRHPLESHYSALLDVARLTKCCTCAVVFCSV